ncbi:MAG: TonB-dependent receptor plug domain-containing protein, partial [Ferruginibacter sp.]
MKKQLHKVLLYATCILMTTVLQLLPAPVRAQSTKISGTVTGTANAPLLLATVTVKQTKRSVVTDEEGRFSVEANKGQTLVITTIGYESQEIIIGDQPTVQVTLLQVSSTLNDVVVVGYGTQKKSDLTGSVASVNIAETKKYTTSDISQLLQGRASGVAVNSDGQPGASPNVRIRGFSTFGGYQPYYVVDGVPGSSIRDFSPNDVESMTVLKDASAAAIYGAAA